MSFLVLVGDDEPDVEMLRTDVRSGSRLCENPIDAMIPLLNRGG